MLSLDDVTRLALAHAGERPTRLYDFLAHLRDGDPDGTPAQHLALAQQAILQLLKEDRIFLERTILLSHRFHRIEPAQALGVLNREQSWKPPDPAEEPVAFCFRVPRPTERL